MSPDRGKHITEEEALYGERWEESKQQRRPPTQQTTYMLIMCTVCTTAQPKRNGLLDEENDILGK